jgi:hypothetical protein
MNKGGHMPNQTSRRSFIGGSDTRIIMGDNQAKFMVPWSFSEEAAAEKYMPQLQHNMWVVAARGCCPLRDHRRR